MIEKIFKKIYNSLMNKFMDKALLLAQKAYDNGEVPIGACIVCDGKIISSAFNKREKTQNAINHAELIAIDKACKKLKSWRLDGCELYVTLEPCPMCAGAISNARIKTVYVGAHEKTSQDNLCEKIFASDRLNFKPKIIFLQEYEEPCGQLISKFFKNKR